MSYGAGWTFGVEFAPFGDCVPLLQAAAAARRRGVLRDEDGMTFPGRLPPVVQRLCGGQTFGDEVRRVLHYDGQTFGAQILRILSAEAKPSAKVRLAQLCENFVEITHGIHIIAV